jgi:hypothetical protein
MALRNEASLPPPFDFQKGYRICGKFNGRENGEDQWLGLRFTAVSLDCLN